MTTLTRKQVFALKVGDLVRVQTQDASWVECRFLGHVDKGDWVEDEKGGEDRFAQCGVLRIFVQRIDVRVCNCVFVYMHT